MLKSTMSPLHDRLSLYNPYISYVEERGLHMNRHTKRTLATILLAVLLGISGVVSSTAGAVLIPPELDEPQVQIVENP